MISKENNKTCILDCMICVPCVHLEEKGGRHHHFLSKIKKINKVIILFFLA
jgi:hypothetical protein